MATSRPARALDTTETWDQGAFDVEATTRLERSFARDRTIAFDALAGYGLWPRFSIYAAGTYERSEGASQLVPGLGVFGTPLETDHVDLDLFLALSLERGCANLTPAFELNLDAQPDLTAWGVFVRGDTSLHEHALFSRVHDPEMDEPWHLGAAIGAYMTLAPEHQLFAQVDGDWVLRSPVVPGALALGYNVRLSDALELITAVAFDDFVHRRAREPGVLAGVIATVPPSP